MSIVSRHSLLVPLNVPSIKATSSYILPRLLGHSRASALFLTGATVTPTSHLIDGLYYKILDTREEVYPAALELAKELAVHTAPVAVQYTKALLRHPGDSIEENHLLDSRGIALLGKSHDAEEGARSFMERREPKFTDNYVDPDWYPWVSKCFCYSHRPTRHVPD